MEYRQLDLSPLKVSRVIFGAWAIGGWMWGGTQEKEALEAIQTSIDHGVNTIDTAAIYGMGLSEELVGKAIQGRREKVIIATKCGMRWDIDQGSDPWSLDGPDGKPITIRKNSNPQSIIYECEQSLKRLNVDVIDLYQIHWPDTSTRLEDSWKAMVQLKEQGKVRAIGVSNFNLDQLQTVQSIHPVDSLQSPYSMLRRDIESDIVPFCRENKIFILGYSPLERGLLTGKVTAERIFPQGDHRSKHPYFTQKNRQRVLSALEQIDPIARKYAATISQVILQCTLDMGIVDAVIVGARNSQQAIENAKATAFKLTNEERSFIADALNQKIIIAS